MNERIVLSSANRFDNMMMMHEQGKLLPNESLYQMDGRFTFDDGAMEELMNGGNSEQLNDFAHMEPPLGKPNFMTNSGPTSLISSMNEDYYNQFPFSQIMMSNSHGNSVNSGMNLGSAAIGNHPGHYSYHSLQPAQSGAHSSQHHLIGSVNPSYAQIGPNSTVVYNSKLLSRTPPYPIVNSSSATSPSASSSSNSSSSSGQLGSGNAGNAGASSGEPHEFEAVQLSSSGGNQSGSSVANSADPAELIRQKQMRGMKLSQEELQLLVKDRQRKDNHNMIERKRRFNINDRIKELGEMLPKNGDYDTKQNKGSILKGSVDYMNQLKSECDEAKKIQEAYKQVLNLNKKLVARIKEYEALCKTNGLTLPGQVNSSASPLSISGANGLGNNSNNLVNPYLSHQTISYHHDPGSLINSSSNMSTINMNGYANFTHSLNESPLMVMDHSAVNNHLPYASNSVNFNNKAPYLAESYQPLNGSSAAYINENGGFNGLASANTPVQQQLNASNAANQQRAKARKRGSNGSAKGDAGREAGDRDSNEESKADNSDKPDEKKPKEEPISPRHKQQQQAEAAAAAATESEKKASSEAPTSTEKEDAPKSSTESKDPKSNDEPLPSAKDNQEPENIYVDSESQAANPKISVVKLASDSETSKVSIASDDKELKSDEVPSSNDKEPTPPPAN